MKQVWCQTLQSLPMTENEGTVNAESLRQAQVPTRLAVFIV
jgi:hypothetical protein